MAGAPARGAGSPAGSRGTLAGWGAYRAVEARGRARAAGSGRAERGAGRAPVRPRAGGRALCSGVEAGAGRLRAVTAPRPAAALSLLISPSARGRRGPGSAPPPPRAALAGAAAWRLGSRVQGTPESRVPTCPRSERDGRSSGKGGRILGPAGLGRSSDGARPANQLLPFTSSD